MNFKCASVWPHRTFSKLEFSKRDIFKAPFSLFWTSQVAFKFFFDTALWCVLKKNWKISNPSSYFLWFWQYFGILWQDWISIFATTCHNLSYLWPKFRNLLCKLDFFYLKLNCNACFLSSHAELSSEKTK